MAARPTVGECHQGSGQLAAEAPPPRVATLETEWMGRFFRALSILKDRLQRSLRWRVGAVLFVLLAAALFFREELGQRKLYLEATAAARSKDFELSERMLEELVGRNPDFDAAEALLLEVSSELVLPALPLELSAKHSHRLGSCTGRLTLRDDGIEYSSKSHGRWHWRFEHIRAIDVGGSRGLTVQTHEDDMLGLLSSKNYNFSVLEELPNEEFLRRYERLSRRPDRPKEDPASGELGSR